MRSANLGNSKYISYYLNNYILVCSGHSFGVQCERTCNCKDNGACDDITGECPNVCQNGWNNDTCGNLSYITIVHVKYDTPKSAHLWCLAFMEKLTDSTKIIRDTYSQTCL